MLKLHHWLVCLLLMNVPVYGTLISAETQPYEYDEMRYTYNKLRIEDRIKQGLKGEDLIKPIYAYDTFYNLLIELEPVDESENGRQYRDYSDLRQRIIDYAPEIKKTHRFFQAFSSSLMHHNLKLIQWFIAEGVNVNLQPGKALEFAFIRCGDDKPISASDLTFIVRLLLLHNVNPNRQFLMEGYNLLHYIVSHSRLDEELQSVISESLIIGGIDYSLKAGRFLSGDEGNEKTAIEIARIEQKFQLASIIEQTALQRDSLFAAVARGENILFRTANPEDPKELESWTSRCHARTIHGDSLLHCAFANDNLPVAQKLIKLWPQLLAQPNFKGETVLYLFPQKCIELLQFNSDL